MMNSFKAAMSKLQVLGQSGLTDCSDVRNFDALLSNTTPNVLFY